MIDFDNRDYLVVNAFAVEPFGGNPAGVFPEAEGLSEPEMQRIARQLNLVETVFVFPDPEPGVDRRLRYFTPAQELPIAGHPTIAAWIVLCHLRLIDPVRTIFRQRTAKGVQEIHLVRRGERIIAMMSQPRVKFGGIVEDRRRASEVFGVSTSDLIEDLPIRAVDTGLGHIVVPLKTLDALMRVERKIEPLRRLCEDFGMREAQLFTFETRDPAVALHTRNLCPRQGIEDPACGVGNAALGAYLAEHCYSDKAEFSVAIEQGWIVEMPSVIDVRVVRGGEADLRIWIGGSAAVMAEGRMRF